VHYYLSDHLGSTSIVASAAGTVEDESDYSPFGTEFAVTSGSNRYKFTGKERDTESQLDYFGSRYMSGAQGRFVSADVVNLTEERMQAPSNTLNKYAYGGSNPVKYFDADGEDITLFYSNGGAAGHAMLLAYNQQTGNSAVQSFGPADHSNLTKLKMAVGLPVSGTANYGFEDIKPADQLRQEYSSITIQISPEETEKAIQYIQTHSDGNYDVYTNNCTTTCTRILRDLHLHAFGELIPNVLFSNLKDEVHKTTSTPSDVFEHGKDYGYPRPGFDPFGVLFLSIQKQKAAAKKPKEVVNSRACYTDDKGKKICIPLD
jgi:RHS repeat-associated protein